MNCLKKYIHTGHFENPTNFKILKEPLLDRYKSYISKMLLISAIWSLKDNVREIYDPGLLLKKKSPRDVIEGKDSKPLNAPVKN